MIVCNLKEKQWIICYCIYFKILSLQLYLYTVKFFISCIVFDCTVIGKWCCHHHLSGLSSVDINGDESLQFTTDHFRKCEIPRVSLSPARLKHLSWYSSRSALETLPQRASCNVRSARRNV